MQRVLLHFVIDIGITNARVMNFHGSITRIFTINLSNIDSIAYLNKLDEREQNREKIYFLLVFIKLEHYLYNNTILYVCRTYEAVP